MSSKNDITVKIKFDGHLTHHLDVVGCISRDILVYIVEHWNIFSDSRHLTFKARFIWISDDP